MRACHAVVSRQRDEGRSVQKNPNFPRNPWPDFTHYLCERPEMTPQGEKSRKAKTRKEIAYENPQYPSASSPRRVLPASAGGRLRKPLRAGAAKRCQAKRGQTGQREQRIGRSRHSVAS